MNRLRCFVSLLLVSSTFTLSPDTLPAQTAEPVPPTVAAASSEGLANLDSIRTPDGMKGGLFAAEPDVANPVAFFTDDQGRVFVCESFRQNQGVTDNRSHDASWLDADLAAQTVEDRRLYHLEHLGDEAISYQQQDDRLRLLVDSDGDGVADESHVFADHFNGLIEGTGAGVLEHEGNVYYACIPNLWRLRDTDGDQRADQRQVLTTGYGVRVAFRGHDLHGFRIGPDGRLYFSIGDRGANVDTADGPVKNVESGSVFRCELDGSKLELFATGLRNPQELAFDDHGNLFTGDNNSDSGDKARWVYVVPGGDSGWRMAYQYLDDRGPFNRERLWHPFHEGQPAYLVPPVANLADGPSGLDYYPGTGFGDEFEGRFFLCDFRGTPSQSGVRSFRVEPDGAFFKVVDPQQTIWSLLATDVQFGPDGGLYVSDWVNGWNGEGKGRIYRFVSETHQQDPIVADVRTLLATGFEEVASDRLAELLAHQDQRVRQKAQFALARRRDVPSLHRIATGDAELLARLHAMWGLEQIARADSASRSVVRESLRGLVDHPHAEVRAHAVRLLGELGGEGLGQLIRPRLADDSLRVRYFAALSLGRLEDKASYDAVVRLLEENDNQDPIVRHGGTMALTQLASNGQLESLASSESVAVRLAAVVALRRNEAAEVARFLDDPDPRVVVEAARAIHDLPVVAAMASLARLIDLPTEDDALSRRILNANFRLGGTEHATGLARYAASTSRPLAMRLEAIAMLADWSRPSGRDRVLGMWRPLAPRDSRVVAEALTPVVGEMGLEEEPPLRLAVARLAGELGIKAAAPILSALVQDPSVRASERSEALLALANVEGAKRLAEIRFALNDKNASLRATALKLLAVHDPAGAVAPLEIAVREGEVQERQAALLALGGLPDQRADSLLAQTMQQLVEGDLPAELHLEALTASASRENPLLRALRERFEATRDPQRPSEQYRETLYGGDAERGRHVFLEKAAVSCVRCHKVFDNGGEVGPELTRIAAEKDRQYLLESIVEPNKAVAKGFESVLIIDDAGLTHVGVLKEETDTSITLMDANAKTTTIAKDSIDERSPSVSAMPADLAKQLTKSELRDLIEFLASLDGRRRGRGPRPDPL